MHDVALVLLQLSVDDCPAVIEVGFAESVAVGGGVTVIVTSAFAEPPVPVHVTEYVVVVAGETGVDPDTASPVTKPVPVHEVALVESQESVAVSPVIMLAGFAANITVGGGVVTVTVVSADAVPPAPVHKIE